MHLGATPTGGIKKPPLIQAWNGGFERDKEIPKIHQVFNKEISISKINLGDITRISYMSPGSWNSLNMQVGSNPLP